jgi:uncharacterized RDD family membrane protein YckC
LDHVLIGSLVAFLLTVWLLPHHAARGCQLIAEMKQNAVRFDGAVFEAMEAADREALIHLIAIARWTCLSVHFLYFFFTEVLLPGGSLGKRTVRLTIVAVPSNGSRRGGRLLLRTLAGTVCSLVLFPLLAVNFLWGLFRRDRRCWHDLIGRTMVVTANFH